MYEYNNTLNFVVYLLSSVGPLFSESLRVAILLVIPTDETSVNWLFIHLLQETNQLILWRFQPLVPHEVYPKVEQGIPLRQIQVECL